MDSRRQLDVMLQLADLRENIRDKPGDVHVSFSVGMCAAGRAMRGLGESSNDKGT